MAKQSLSDGVVHKLPLDLKQSLSESKKASDAWEDITPLARNEWICWVEDAKLKETRERRISRAYEELQKGKRRPCCWPGCPHRKKK